MWYLKSKFQNYQIIPNQSHLLYQSMEIREFESPHGNLLVLKKMATRGHTLHNHHLRRQIHGRRYLHQNSQQNYKIFFRYFLDNNIIHSPLAGNSNLLKQGSSIIIIMRHFIKSCLLSQLQWPVLWQDNIKIYVNWIY